MGFPLLQLHGWNYDLVPTNEDMRAEGCIFVREGRHMSNTNGVSLDDVSMEYDIWQDTRPIPPDSVVLEPPRTSSIL